MKRLLFIAAVVALTVRAGLPFERMPYWEFVWRERHDTPGEHVRLTYLQKWEAAGFTSTSSWDLAGGGVSL